MSDVTRTEHAKSNIVASVVSYLVKMVCAFVSRTILIKYLGVMYLGLNGLFTGILSMLSLAELGIGSALVFSLYKPIADNDEEKVKQLLKLYKNTYTIIGLIVMGVGVCLMPFLKSLIADEATIPTNINIYIVYFIFVLNSALSYFVAYKRSLLFVCQRTDVENKSDMCIQIISTAVQCLFVILLKNYYSLVIISLIFVVIQNIVITIITNKLYPQYNGRPKEDLPKDEKTAITKNVGALLFHKIGAVVASSGVDSIVISAFIGIVELGKYSNYLMIMTYISSIISLVVVALKGGIGNSLVEKNVEDNKKIFYKLNFALFWIIGFCGICLMNLFNPFIQVWIGEEFKMSILFVILFSVQFFITNMRLMVNSYKECLGYFKQDMFKPLIESILNILISIILAKNIGIIGVVLGTIMSQVIACVWFEPWILYKNYFKESVFKYWAKIIYYIIIIVGAAFVTYFICYFIKLDNVVGLILKSAICLVVPNLIFIIFYFKTAEFRELFDIIKVQIFKKKKKI